MNEEFKNIEEIIIDFFSRAGFSVEIKNITRKNRDNDLPVVSVNIKTNEAQMLIGKQGLVLSDVQLLLRKLIKKKIGEEMFLNLDIDNYKKNKENYLRDIAQEVADEVAKTKTSKEMLLSSPFDRKIVHTELADRLDVNAESIGEGEDRRILVSPMLD